MNLGRNTFFIGFFAMCLPVISWAGEIPVINITDKTNPEIAELYKQYQDIQGKIDQIQSERVDKLGDNYKALKENEQSLENRTLTATTTAATGIGGMELAQGLAEQKADKTAEQSMTNYIATMRCKYGDTQVKAGLEEIELPGGNDSEMANLRNEYFTLAADLKERKAALGMKPGIESEEILDKSEMGLYDNENIGISDGAYASLYRAQMYNSEKDKQEIDAAKESTENRVVGGATAAGAGVVAGVVGNATINKNAPKNESDAINREYDKKLADATAEQKDIAAQLESAIAENANAVKQYNKELQQHKALVETIKKSPENCHAGFDDYIETISKLSPIENETDDVTNDLPDFDEQQEKLNKCTTPGSNASGGASENAGTYGYDVEGDGGVVDFGSEQQLETDATECCSCSSESGSLTLSRTAKLSRAAAQVVQKSNDKCCACTAPTTPKKTTITYKAACGDYKGKEGAVCINNVFTNKTIGGTQVDVQTAKGLSKEWARVNGYREIVCSDAKPREIPVLKSTDYGVQCASKEPDKQGKRAYFEFIFDDTTHPFSESVRINASRAICEKIYKKSGSRAPNQNFHCLTDKETCSKINTTMNNIYTGSTAKITVVSGQNRCVMSWTTQQNRSSVRNDFKGQLDSFVFCKGAQTQLRNDQTLENMLRQYIANKLKINISSVKCSDGSRPYYGSECGNKGTSEDVKSCSVGDKVIEFVLDDIHETSKKKQQGAKQSMSCVVSGGTFNGQECKFANKKQCDVFIESTTKICPECKKPKWNPNTNLCELPDAATVTKMEKRERRAMIVGGVVVSVVVTAATLGTGATVVGVVLSSVEVAGGAMEYFAQRKIDGMAHDFFIKSAKCNNASCAKGMIANNMQEMANIANDLETYEIEALDYEFARLLNLIDPESDFYKKIVANGATIEDNKKGFFDPDGWNQAQVWRAIGIGLQLASVGEALITKIAGTSRFASKFPKMQETLLSKVKITRKSATIAKPTEVADAAKGTEKTMNVSYKEGKQLVKAGKWADATVLDPTFDIKVTPLELGGKKYYLKAGNTETLIQNEISRTKQAHELLKHNKIVTSVGVVEDDQTVLKAFMDAHPEITLPRTPDTQYFIMDATHVNTIEWSSSDAEILGYLRNKPITIEEQNTILSEIQNMNNNGLIHNDIWHNFAIYRDSGGKLHMELMDFGDFTAEDKLFRSNDDVLEIKKLFSKWSDRGLVEKGVAKKADNISVATSSVSATKADNVADAVTTTSKQKETTRPVLYNIDSQSGSEISEINKINGINNTNGDLTQKPIGFIREVGVNRDELPDIIKNFKKDGYRLEVVDDINDTKMYKIFADNENDIEEAQKRLLETASSQSDKNARLAAVGNYYNPKFEADSFYNSYKESAKELLLNDPDVEKARQNWDNMNEYERWKFEHQTNRKIRRQLINEDASPVAYGRTDSGAAASYGPQRIGSEAEQTAKELDGYDKYNLNSNTSFEAAMENLVHENYHYAQDVGKTETPKWLLDYNTDNYTRDGAGGYGAYHQQPLESGVKALGWDVRDAFLEKNMTEKLEDLRKTSYKLRDSDYTSQRRLGDDMYEFLNNPTSDNYEKFRETAKVLKDYDGKYDGTKDVIKSFDTNDFWDYTRSMAEKTDAAKQSNSGAQRLTSESNNNFSGFNLGDDVPKKTNEADDIARGKVSTVDDRFSGFNLGNDVPQKTNETNDFVNFGKPKPTEPIKMSDFGSSKSSFNVGETGNASTSTVRSRPNTATQQGATKRNTSGFKVGGSGRPNNTRAKTVSETTSLDWIQKGEEEGRARIDKFREKYDLSINGRKKYTREQWYEILDNELGYSDAEEAFKKDFKQGMRESYW